MFDMVAETGRSKRILTPDVIKGFVITVIVLGHLLFLSPDGADRGETALPIQVLYTGLMLFFVISGYFYKPGRGYLKNVEYRTAEIVSVLIIAAIAFPLILIAYMACLGQSVDLSLYPQCILDTVGLGALFQPLSEVVYNWAPFGASTGYYYLMAMMVAFVMFYAVVDWALKGLKYLVATVLAFLVFQFVFAEFLPYYLPFFAQLSCMAVALMVFGAYLGKMHIMEQFEAGAWKTKMNLGILAASVVAVCVVAYFFHPGMEFDNCKFGYYGGYSVFPFYVTALLLIPFAFNLAFFVSKVPFLGKLLSIVGQHTLAILVMHCFVIKMLVAPFYPLVGGNGVWFPVMPTSVSVVAGLLSIAIITLISIYVFPRLLSKIHKA